jgi:hypothetical protein
LVILNNKDVKSQKPIQSDSISNVKLLNLTHYGKPVLDVAGCVWSKNKRDVFLNVNYQHERGVSLHNFYSKIIIHETIHNLLSKYVGVQTSKDFDNLVLS